MRKFVIADIHGNGDIYDTIISYLENINETEEVELYINGDLIDRGLDSFRVLMDVKERIEGKGNIKIHYLGGNHELMMYNALRKRKPGKSINHWCDWMNNGGWLIEGELDCRDDGEELCDSFRDFMGELKIYHIFDEKIKDNNLLLVHAQAPLEVLEKADMRIKDNNSAINRAVWTRKEEREVLFFGVGRLLGLNRIGLDGYFSVIGHTPVKDKNGFIIYQKENYINIDGGCAAYAVGRFEYDHVPLLEIKDNYLEILVFNHNNEIMRGFYYDGDLINMNNEDLEQRRVHLNSKYDGQAKVYQKEIKEIMDIL